MKWISWYRLDAVVFKASMIPSVGELCHEAVELSSDINHPHLLGCCVRKHPALCLILTSPHMLNHPTPEYLKDTQTKSDVVSLSEEDIHVKALEGLGFNNETFNANFNEKKNTIVKVC